MALFRGLKALLPKYTSTSPSGFSYDVFLSFRGEDTRKNFTDHLYTALVNAGFHTFRDDPQLERGENIKEELEKAIQQSRSSVIVFSKDYTSSRWCLDELVMILQRRRTFDHVVLPVYYDVDPSQVRKQAKGLAKFPKYKSSKRLNIWQAALGEVADLAGMVLANDADGHESKFIQNVVRVIQDKLGRVPLTNVQEVLQKKLLFINPILDDAEGKQLNNPTVKAWVNELKEVVYDTDDLLQEIKAEALRRKMEPESGSSTSTVQELNFSLPSHAFDSALIYPRVEEVLNRLDSIMEWRKDVLGLEASVGYRVSQTLQSTSLVKDSGVCGRDDEKETLVKLLLSVSDGESGNKMSVIPIVGMGGIGKTTLAQLLYNDVRVEHHFDIQAWAFVSEKFDVLHVSQQIYESLTSNACNIVNLNLLHTEMKAALMGKKIFLVLDDVWNMKYTEWKVLMLPFQFGAHGSKIIVTTRNQDVARMVSSLEAHRLKPMSEEDGWSLFEKHAFKIAGVGAYSHLEEIGRQIVRKCKGLPLAIKSLGGLLCSKLIVGEWETILNSDIWELPLDSDILPSLWLSYMHLPSQLKHCFAYCSIFPKNYAFKTSEVVCLWKAEDLLQPEKNKTAEKIGQEYFKNLISMSFFQLSSSSSDQYFMHDLINDLASYVSGEFCFRWDGRSSPNILSKTRHFSYRPECLGEDDGLEMFEALQQAKCLHTFLPLEPKSWRKLLGEGGYHLLPKLQCLRVLKLSRHNIEELPDSINNLKHLRYLDLSWTPIEKLPDTICTLYNLQALLLSNCYALSELPAHLGRLINLSHLDITGLMLKKMPPDMGNLKDLQMLPKFVLDKSTARDNLPELKKLQNLSGRLCISGLAHSSGMDFYILRDKKFLNELVLNWERNRSEEREVLEKLQPHLNLERLTIEGYGGKMFPGWSEYYYSSALVYLQLVDCVNCISLPPLGQLPSLRELYIEGLHGVVSIGSEIYYGDSNTASVNKPFRSLRSLNFYNMSGWKEWSYVGGYDNEGVVFPNLLQLYVSKCPNLSGRLVLDNFPMLNKLRITNLSLVSELLSLNELNQLWLNSCPNFGTFFGGALHAPNLTNLEIVACENFSSWPKQMHSLLPSLVDLCVQNCRELESFPEGGFPSKLKSLVIKHCKKLNVKSVQNMNQGLSRLTSLEKLTLDFDCDEEVDWFVERRVLPSTLTDLRIHRLNCKTIDGFKWFGHLYFLEKLEISDCPALQCLPEGLPSAHCLQIWNCPALQCLPDRLPICKLNIRGCPLLEKRCQKDTGEDWPKIAHIRVIMNFGLIKSP